MHAMPVILVVLCCLAIAYRYYSAFLAAKVVALDDSRKTPAHTLYDGQNYHPTSKWVLFGHHFAAISGAGPLIGPVLAIQFGYLPGLVWIVVGVCLAGAVQDMLVLAASVRRNGRSLAEIARSEIGPVAGLVASITILFIVVVALAGLGIVVVKALGGEEIKLAAGTVLEKIPESSSVKTWSQGRRDLATLPHDTRIIYVRPGNEADDKDNPSVTRSEMFTIARPWPAEQKGEGQAPFAFDGQRFVLPAGVTQAVPGSSWGTFTIACTIPIALFVGLYMYKIRKGRVVEASIIGAAATIGATIAGNWIPGSPLEPYFSLTREWTIISICVYGFIASVLPVWMLLCPRDYLSSFLKIGTVVLLVGSVIVANPKLEAPAINELFVWGGGPYVARGPLFPFCFICIMCGAISGFHALVSSGTTPKMVSQESHVRTIGYGAMLIEGLVAVIALIAAASLPQGDYWAINIDLKDVQEYADQLDKMDATRDNLPEIERQVGGESLRGRTGGAVTLAVGMSQVMTEAMRRVSGGRISVDSVIKYWFHFAIMFEALFILTTIDTGTRIARFLLQEALGKIYKPFDRPDWLPGAVLATAVVTASWGGLIWTGSIDTIWPMFGIANQMLAVIGLVVVTTVMINAGRGRYAFLTIVPMTFVIVTTTYAGVWLVSKPFSTQFAAAWNKTDYGGMLKWGLNIAFTSFIIAAVLTIVLEAVVRWVNRGRGTQPEASGMKPV